MEELKSKLIEIKVKKHLNTKELKMEFFQLVVLLLTTMELVLMI